MRLLVNLAPKWQVGAQPAIANYARIKQNSHTLKERTVQERGEHIEGEHIEGEQVAWRKSYYSSLKGDHLSPFNSCLEQSDTKRVTLERWLKYIAPSTGPGQDSALCPTFTYTTKIGLLSWWAAKNGPTGLLARFKNGIRSPMTPGFFFDFLDTHRMHCQWWFTDNIWI